MKATIDRPLVVVDDGYSDTSYRDLCIVGLSITIVWLSIAIAQSIDKHSLGCQQETQQRVGLAQSVDRLLELSTAAGSDNFLIEF